MKKIRIFFDMDGVLNVFDKLASIEETTQSGFFLSRTPIMPMITLVNVMESAIDTEVYILSNVYNDDHSIKEKIEWNQRYINVPVSRQLYVPYDTPKEKALDVIGGIRPTDILVDDFSKNLFAWSGFAVKFRNGINGTHGTWKGYSISLADNLIVALCKIVKWVASGNVVTSKKENVKYWNQIDHIIEEAIAQILNMSVTNVTIDSENNVSVLTDLISDAREMLVERLETMGGSFPYVDENY